MIVAAAHSPISRSLNEDTESFDVKGFLDRQPHLGHVSKELTLLQRAIVTDYLRGGGDGDGGNMAIFKGFTLFYID